MPIVLNNTFLANNTILNILYKHNYNQYISLLTQVNTSLYPSVFHNAGTLAAFASKKQLTIPQSTKRRTDISYFIIGFGYSQINRIRIPRVFGFKFVVTFLSNL